MFSLMKSGRRNEVQQLHLHCMLLPHTISFLLLARPLDYYRSWSETEERSQLFSVCYYMQEVFVC